MIAAVNILQNKFGGSKNLPTFVMPNRLRSTRSQQFISNRLNKAGFLRQFYFGSLGRFGDFQGRLASFAYTYFNFSVKTMPNRHENLSQTPKVCSASTPAPCKRATTVRKSRTIQPSGECRPITPYSELKAREKKVACVKSSTLYQITLNLVVSRSEANGRARTCSVIYTDIYQASNENEALGLAVATTRAAYGQFQDIDLKSLKCNRTYNIPSK